MPCISADAELAIVEGNRGLYDGVDVLGGYSTAELAVTLDLPVILVVNCTKTTRTVAAMVLGCQQFDNRIKIKGVVLNQIATERQRRLITESVEKYTGIPVLGSIPRLKRDIFPMRHLGMVPHQEYTDSHGALDFLVDLIEENVDLDRVEAIMGRVPNRFTCRNRTTRTGPNAAKSKDRDLAGRSFSILLFRESGSTGKSRGQTDVY